MSPEEIEKLKYLQDDRPSLFKIFFRFILPIGLTILTYVIFSRIFG